jgi:tRNA-specific 2-thiouridylase
MQLWNQRRLPELSSDAATGRCCSLDDVYDARHVAEQLAIPYYVVNFGAVPDTQVVEPSVSEYLAGARLSCTLCNNSQVRPVSGYGGGGAGADCNRPLRPRHARPVTGRYLLRRAIDAGKDQTYFLFGLTQRQLARTLFPLGEMKKVEVRALARQMHLAVAEKDESYEICFVPNGDYAAFMDAYLHSKGREIEERQGEIVSHDGRALGEHTGVHHFTVGQRRGLGIAASEPLYVISTDPATQRVTVGPGDRLYRASLIACHVNWISGEDLAAPARAEVKIRKAQAAAATLYPTAGPDRVEVRFDEPQRAITPGRARFSTMAIWFSVADG